MGNTRAGFLAIGVVIRSARKAPLSHVKSPLSRSIHAMTFPPPSRRRLFGPPFARHYRGGPAGWQARQARGCTPLRFAVEWVAGQNASRSFQRSDHLSRPLVSTRQSNEADSGEMSAPRKLAAILAADVAGYSRLTGADEEGTLKRLRKVRRELINPAVALHRGRIV